MTITPIIQDQAADAPAAKRSFARSTDQLAGEPSFHTFLTKAEGATAVVPTAPTAPTAPTVPTSSSDSASSSQSVETTPRSLSTARVDRSAADVGVAEDDDFTFDDLVDVVNPLQHIPVIGTIYRAITGDEIKPVARVVGDVAYGALTGGLIISGVASLASAAIEQNDGAEPLVQLASAIFGDRDVPSDDNSGDIPADNPVASAVAETQLASAVPPTGVNPASTEGEKAVQVASVEPASRATAGAATTKAPFGGVMAPPNAQGAAPQTTTRPAARPAQELPALASLQGTRIGSMVYTGPLLNHAARIAVPQAARATQAEPSPVTTDSSPARDDHAALGQKFQAAAESQAAGAKLPPELVRDMMQMALDRYKATASLGAGGAALTPATRP